MTRRTAVLAFEAGQFAIAICALVFVAEAPDRVVAVFYLGMLAYAALAVTAIYAALGTLRRDAPAPVVNMTITGNADGGASGNIRVIREAADRRPGR